MKQIVSLRFFEGAKYIHVANDLTQPKCVDEQDTNALRLKQKREGMFPPERMEVTNMLDFAKNQIFAPATITSSIRNQIVELGMQFILASTIALTGHSVPSCAAWFTVKPIFSRGE